MRIAGRVVGARIIGGAIVFGIYVTRLYYVYPRTDDAYVRPNVVGIAPHVSGPITELPVQDNQHVKQANCCSWSIPGPTSRRPISPRPTLL